MPNILINRPLIHFQQAFNLLMKVRRLIDAILVDESSGKMLIR